MNGRNKLIVGGVVAGGSMLLAAGLVIGAGIAKADTQWGSIGDSSGEMYAHDLAAVDEGMIGLVSDRQAAWQAADRGIAICRSRHGKTQEAMIANMVTHGWQPHHAEVAVIRAEFHFCPEMMA
jgi:hypothetical protein